MEEVGALTQPQTQTQSAKSTLAADFDAFLLLLTTQLKHQDPLSPLEPTEFTNQLVQFASVEQQIATNEHLENLLLVQNASLASAVVGFIGTEIQAVGSNFPLQDGQGKFTYSLPENAKQTAVLITDKNGSIVYSEAGELSAGEHKFTWDGKDNNGIDQPDGPYRVSVTAIGFEDGQMPVNVIMSGKVTGVSMGDGGTKLDAGGVEIDLDKILAIKDPDSGDPS